MDYAQHELPVQRVPRDIRGHSEKVPQLPKLQAVPVHSLPKPKYPKLEDAHMPHAKHDHYVFGMTKPILTHPHRSINPAYLG